MESFNSRFRDEFLNIELFTSVQEAKLLAEQHRIEYNTFRPHRALQGRKPLEGPTPVEIGLTIHQFSEELDQQRGVTSASLESLS